MENTDFSTTILVDRPAREVLDAVNDVRGWWTTKVHGTTTNLNDEFMVDFGSHWWAFGVIETVPLQKVVWKITGSYMPWNADLHEWTGTTIVFEIATEGAQTQLVFTHKGLVPLCSCFSGCSKGWTGYINTSLRNLITSGAGTPDFPY